MKYYIVGKQTVKGTLDSDSATGRLNEYFELGWEYMTTQLYVKNLYRNGSLHADDCIVTLKDRMFIYQGIWDNVLSYDEFINDKSINSADIIDVCDMVEENRTSYLPKLDAHGNYIHFDSMRDLMLNIKYVNISHLNTKDKYCCVHIRYRGYAKHRNIKESFWVKLLDNIINTGVNVYVFGKEASKFDNGTNIKHVNLDEYASLLNNINCKFIIGNMSGGTLVSQTFAHKDCIQYVIIGDEQTMMEFNMNNEYKVFYHIPGLNFSNAPIEYINMIDSEEFVLDDIYKKIKQ